MAHFHIIKKNQIIKFYEFLIPLGFFIIVSCSSLEQETTISKKDFEQIIGNWNGSLTYLDYSSNTPYTMPADVNVEQIGQSNQFILHNIFPDEPNANSADTLIISQDGRMINKQSVISKKILSGGNIEITTEYLGKDGNENKEATIRHNYTLGKNKFIMSKEVQFTNTREWIKRNEFNYVRK